ncbi:MAG: hypothetical protein KJ584_05030, partial [Candidatus Omnitrophica bacterium]|nr:hypothetical protein [Candidatus Omnitrophota bacterium]
LVAELEKHEIVKISQNGLFVTVRFPDFEEGVDLHIMDGWNHEVIYNTAKQQSNCLRALQEMRGGIIEHSPPDKTIKIYLSASYYFGDPELYARRLREFLSYEDEHDLMILKDSIFRQDLDALSERMSGLSNEEMWKKVMDRLNMKDPSETGTNLASDLSLNLPETAVPEASPVAIAAAQSEADRIHAENLSYTPAIPDKTILCHIVTDSILPVQQRGILKTLEQDMRNDKYGEKVVSLAAKDLSNPEEFMLELERITAREEARYPGYKIQFDVACPSKDLVAKIQAKGIQALAFGKGGDGDIIQVEGIILALRALQAGNISNLLNVYKLLTGRELTADTTDINELARMMLFILPVRKLDVNAIGTLNRIIEENIKTAA